MTIDTRGPPIHDYPLRGVGGAHQHRVDLPAPKLAGFEVRADVRLFRTILSMVAFLPQSVLIGTRIMEQGFPPELPSDRLTIVLLHVVLLAMLLGEISGLVIQVRRKTTPWSVLAWGVGGALLALVTMVIVIPIYSHLSDRTGFGIALLLIVAALCLIGLVQSIFRLSPETPANFIVLVIAAFTGVCLFLPFAAPTVLTRASVQRIVCHGNLSQLRLALLNYHDEFKRLPPTAGGQPAASWRVRVLPWIDRAPLYNAYDFGKNWDEPPNAKHLLKEIRELQCPSLIRRHDEQGRYFSSYIAPVGPQTVFGLTESRRLEDIPDGPSNTLLLVEACGLEILWTDPRDFDVTRGPVGINLKGRGQTDSPGLLSSYHRGGANVLMADGSVRFLSEKIDPAVLDALLTADGGDDVTGWE